jgi:hypothetical protein
MRQASQGVKFMQSIIALLIVGGATWWFAFEALQPAGPDDLKVEVGDLRSSISEAEQIIEQAEAGKLTATFFQVELELLRDQAETARKNLGAEKPQPGLEGKFAAARGLAETARDVISRLLPLFNQPQQMNSEKAKLEKVSQQAVALEESLKQ